MLEKQKDDGEGNGIFELLLCALNHRRHVIYIVHSHEQFWKGYKMVLILLLSQLRLGSLRKLLKVTQ